MDNILDVPWWWTEWHWNKVLCAMVVDRVALGQDIMCHGGGQSGTGTVFSQNSSFSPLIMLPMLLIHLHVTD
jgi:hypothetical protein